MAKMLGKATRNRITAVMEASKLEDLLHKLHRQRLRSDIGELFRSASSKTDDLMHTLSVMAGIPTAEFELVVQAIEAIEVHDWPDVHAANACVRHLQCIRGSMWPDCKFTGPLSSIGASNWPIFKGAFDALRASSPSVPARDVSAAQVTA